MGTLAAAFVGVVLCLALAVMGLSALEDAGVSVTFPVFLVGLVLAAFGGWLVGRIFLRLEPGG